MTAGKLIVFLRSVNVNGKNLLNMNAFRDAARKAGFGEAVTYIQSGNIVIHRPELNATDAAEKIHELILEKFGLDIKVFVKTPEELYEIIKNNPFSLRDNCDASKWHVSMLAGTPDSLQELASVSGQDEYIIVKDVIYLNCPNGYGNTRLTHSFFERRFGMPVTTRNWRTLCRMLELSGMSNL